MNKHRSSLSTVSMLLGASLAFGMLQADDTVIDEKFETPLASPWAVRPKDAAKVMEGQLTLIATGPDTDYAVSNVFYTAPSEALNFSKNAVQIALTDLTVQGSAEVTRQVFILALTNDNLSESEATSQFRLRIDGNGGLIVRVQDKGYSTPLLSLEENVKFPIQTLVLKLSSSGVALSYVDADGSHEANASFDAAPARWSDAAPFLRFQIQRNPGPGDAQILLRRLDVTSKAAAASK